MPRVRHCSDEAVVLALLGITQHGCAAAQMREWWGIVPRVRHCSDETVVGPLSDLSGGALALPFILLYCGYGFSGLSISAAYA